MDLGKVGVWWSGSWTAPAEPSVDVAAELEALGYGTLWSSGGFEPGLAPRFGRLLASTSRLAVASGIVSIWPSSPQEIAQAVTELEDSHPGRFVLGLGASHAAIVDHYSHPYGRIVDYLDLLDGSEPTVPADRRVLAALGPRMLTLAGARAAGAHPYFVPVEHTARAREILGAGPLLAPEVTVVLEEDPTTARALARGFTTRYLGLPNYVQNLRRLGYDDDDVAGGGSDRLVDAVVGWGDVDAIVTRVQEHHDAGADHVCIQVVSDAERFPLREYRELAAGLLTD
jgi:probable F420-dependent oxidoreductase